MSSIKFNFKAIHEIKVNRRAWYDASLFALDVVKEVLKKNPTLANKTRHVITSIILARGISLEFLFDEKTHYQRMKDFKGSVGGGVSVGFVSFGAKGHYHQHDFTQENTDQTQTITFADDPAVCRILALRYDELHQEGSRDDFFYAFNYLGEFDPQTQAIVDKVGIVRGP